MAPDVPAHWLISTQVRGNVDDDEARKSTPALWSYVAAWLCVVASVAASALYLLSFGSSLGVRASRLWLLELLYTCYIDSSVVMLWLVQGSLNTT